MSSFGQTGQRHPFIKSVDRGHSSCKDKHTANSASHQQLISPQATQSTAVLTPQLCISCHRYGPGQLDVYLSYMPVSGRRYYDVVVGSVHIFSLDSDPREDA